MKLHPENLLRNSVIFQTDDVLEFHHYIANFNGRVERRADVASPTKMELRHAALGGLHVALGYYGCTMVVTASRQPSDDYLLQFPLSGVIDLELSGHEYTVAPGNAVIIGPGQVTRRLGRPGWTLVFEMPATMVRSRLEQRVGRAKNAGLVFQPLVSFAAKELLDYALLVVDAIDRGAAKTEGAVAEVLANGLIDLLLTLQPHTFGKVILNSGATTRSDRISALTEYLNNHASEPITVARLARVAGCSKRSLQKTFAELCGMTPLQYVRRHRLFIARKLLESADEQDSVSEVARQTGFAHAGRFATQYKAIYGESPSETRRRAACARGTE